MCDNKFMMLEVYNEHAETHDQQDKYMELLSQQLFTMQQDQEKQAIVRKELSQEIQNLDKQLHLRSMQVDYDVQDVKNEGKELIQEMKNLMA